MRIDTAVPGVGCPYPRTIRKIGNAIYFLGQDNQVHRFDGNDAPSVSLPVNDSLRDIKLYWSRMPCAGVRENEYWLAYPSGTAIVTSTGSLSNGTTGTAIFGSDSGVLTVTDGTAWDLSGVAIGDHLQNEIPEAFHGIITAVNDGTDTVTMEEGSETNSTGYDFSALRNDREVVFDTFLNTWRAHRGRSVYCYAWDYPRSRRLYAGLYGNGYVIEADTTDATDFNSAVITSLWKSPIITAPLRTQFHGVRVVQIGGSESSLTVKAYLDHKSTAGSTPTAATPESNDKFWFGFEDAVGHSCQVTVEGAAMGTIVAIILEYTVMQ